VTETALLIAQIAVLLLLFGFVWAVVRSSSRTVARAAPPPLPLEDPVERSDTAAHPVPRRAPAPAQAPAPAAAPAPAVVAAAPLPASPPSPVTDPFAGRFAAPIPPEEPPDPVTDTGGNGRVRANISTADALAANITPRLVVENGPGRRAGEEITLGGGLTIGRSRSNDVHLDDTYVSHMHARILRRGAFYQVQDLGSTNGTFLNGQRIEAAQLRPRDELRMGETTLRYEE